MMNVRQIFNDVIALCGIYDPQLAPQPAVNHVLRDITAAIQFMQMAGEDFFAREELPISLVENQSAYTLGSGIQRILEPGRLGSSGNTLISIRTRAQFDSFGPTFMGVDSPDPGSPIAYFIDAIKSSSGEDPCAVTIRVVPTPAAPDTLFLYIIRNAPIYTINDLETATSPIPPVPHKYHETILLPLVRMYSTTCHLFSAHEQLQSIQSDYDRALSLLGLADPRKASPNTISPDLRSNATRQQQQQP